MRIKLQTLYIFLICCVSLNAQSFLEGTPEWTYCYQCSSLGGSFEGERIVSYSKDVRIQDTIIKEFVVTSHYVNVNDANDIRGGLDTIYLYEENDKVYRWHYPESQKELMYNFSSQVEDTLLVSQSGCLDPTYFIIDSVSTVNVSGIDLKSQSLYVSNENWSFWNEIIVVNKLGAISGDYLEFKTQYNCGFDACSNSHKFQNYSNEALGLFYGNAELCKGITSSVTEKAEMIDLTIYPNPTDTYFEISDISDIDRIEILSLNGKLIQSTEIKSTRVDINLNSGVYLLRFLKNNIQLSQRRLIISKNN